ncbi:MAG: Dps family protein [Balneolales bacterium]
MNAIIEKSDTKMNIGISDEHRETIAKALGRLLANSYTLYLKTQNYHWNVTGMNFHALHEMFEEQYTELAGAIDEIAERIRALGHFAPGSFKAFEKISSVTDEDEVPDERSMVQNLVVDNETVIRISREVLSACENAGDESTLDLVTERLRNHSKVAWMLRSHLQ